MTERTAPISITYEVPGSAPITETFEFLVVACDPRLLNFEQLTDLEGKVTRVLTSHTFQTSLIHATRPDVPQIPIGGGDPQDEPNYAIRFNPTPLSDMNQEMYAYRDEVYTRDQSSRPSPIKTTWATCYQIEDKSLIGRPQQVVKNDFDNLRDATLNDRQNWCDLMYDPSLDNAPSESVIVDYFPHFTDEHLSEGLPWDVLHAQGLNNTMYISSFASFESVLHCFLYQNSLMSSTSTCYNTYFPKDKNANIAVIGAGPSGILFASQHLATQGYNNFRIFEKDDRIGGKSYTFKKPSPADHSVLVPCELGTCYLSLAYFPLFSLFSTYHAGTVEGLSGTLRSVFDPDVATDDQEQQSGIEFSKWIMLKNGAIPNNTAHNARVILQTFLAMAYYCVIHHCIMHMSPYDAIPESPPDEITVKKNIDSIVEKVRQRNPNQEDGEIDAFTAIEVITDMASPEHKGIFQEVALRLKNTESSIRVSHIMKARNHVFTTSFKEFLETNHMEKLCAPLVYGYQVQGYGTIADIPAYYGMVWISPLVAISFGLDALQQTLPNGMSTTNLCSKGWLTLWKNMADQDLGDKIVLNANITSISRVLNSPEHVK